MKIRPKSTTDEAVLNAQVAILNCEVAGMQAENEQRASNRQILAYTDNCFFLALERFEASIAFMVEPDPVDIDHTKPHGPCSVCGDQG